MACSKETLVSFGLSTQQTSKKREGKGTSHRGILLPKDFRLFHLSPYKMILEPGQQWMEGWAGSHLNQECLALHIFGSLFKAWRRQT